MRNEQREINIGLSPVRKSLHPPSSILHPRSGQALVEALVAISVALVGFLGITNLLASSLSLNRAVAENYIATYLAAEGIEVVKNLLDANFIQEGPPANCEWDTRQGGSEFEVEYNALSSGNSCPGLALENDGERFLSFNPSTHRYSYSGSEPTRFRRLIRITQPTSSELWVVSKVEWPKRGGGAAEVVLEDRFFDWRP